MKFLPIAVMMSSEVDQQEQVEFQVTGAEQAA